MIIKQIDEKTIKIYGKESTEAWDNAKQFIEIIGLDRWRGHTGAQIDGYPGTDTRWAITMDIKPATEHVK